MGKRFVLAPDSFKESMTAVEVCEAMAAGIKVAMPDAEVIKIPLADGGEGTVASLVQATHGQQCTVSVMGPLPMQTIQANFGLLGNSNTAVIEMAAASGLELLTPEERDPRFTTTYGTGELIKAALDMNVDQIIIGLGGSATNDGGAGMAQALGVKLLDEKGNELPVGGAALANLATIETDGIDKRLQQTKILLASDVTNPLTGPEGATRVFGKQKGATSSMIASLDASLEHYATVIKQQLGHDVTNVAGAGAAGGLGAGLLAFTDAKISSGIQTIIEMVGLADQIKTADYVLTGEGGIDFQTKFGKTPFGVAKIAKQYNKLCIVLAGYVGAGIETLYDEGITAVFGILGQAGTLQDSFAAGFANIKRTTENVVRLLSN